MNDFTPLPPHQKRAVGLSDSDAKSIGNRLCADLVERWQRGERVPVEAYLRQHPQLEGDEAVFELVLTEVVLRQNMHVPTPLAEFLWRFPHFEERLRRHFALHEGLTNATTTVTSSKPPLAAHVPLAVPAVPGYEVIAELGRGGMGVVYQALDTQLGRQVALKFLPMEYAADRFRLDRFLREARTASALNHPHICTVHALGEYGNRPYIVMEFVDGCTLQSLVDRRPAVDEAIRLFGQVAEALAAAHAEGVVHRDIKPENIMVREDSYVKVVDFGLARRLPTLTEIDSGGMLETDPGTLIGTVSYMSPEQTRGSSASSASDMFSLGIVLYELLTGTHPFTAESAPGTLHAIAEGQFVPPSRLNPEIPMALEALIEAMLHKDGKLRPTAAELGTALKSLASGGAARPVKLLLHPIVHREQELGALRDAFDAADAGSGALVGVVGEPGIGKTTLIEGFLDQLVDSGRTCLVARGHCSERLVDTEAYLPVIDALDDLLRADPSGSTARLMKIMAPTWYARISPQSVAPSPADSVETSRAASQPAMLREFCNLLQEVSRLGPVVLFFDDVHWADISTVDLLAHVGRTCREMRVLVIVTYRPTEMLLGPHAFHRVKQELQVRGTCTELSVRFLDRRDVDRYLDLAFPNHTLPADFADLVYARTEGSPLFMANLLRYLQERGVIAEAGGRWALARALPDLLRELPESVRSMIQRKFERLAAEDRQLLAAASIQGHEFDSAVVAETLQREAADVEERLQKLDEVHGLVRRVREYEFPDRTLTLRYAFVHILYQQTLYNNLQPTRRTALSAALADALVSHQGEATAAAAELACLYEVGRDFARAAQQFTLAAQNAAHVFAHQEAVTLARRGLQLLEGLPDSPERAGLELPLQTMLGMQLQVTQGFASPEAKTAYLRARELCRQAPDSVPLFPVLWGLWLFSKVRSELPKAQEMADRLLALARELCDPNLALQSHQALGMTAFCRGRPTEAVAHVEKVAAHYDPDRHRRHSFLFGQDPGVICKAYGAIALWLLGYADQAERQSDEAIRTSGKLSPSSQAVALHFAAMLHQLGRDHVRARECAEASSSIAAEHGFSFWLAGGSVLSGWSLAAGGRVQEGIGRLRQGLRDWAATDSVTYKTYYLGLLAEVLNAQGQIDESLQVVEAALALVEQTGERLYESELHRLRGELLLKPSGSSHSVDAAEQCFRQALSIARTQRCVSLELRAAVSAARLARDCGQIDEARTILLPFRERMTEGFTTPDYQAAVALLDEKP